MQLLNFTLVAGGLFLLTGALHHRVGSNDIHSLGGAARSMPMLASFFLLLGLAGMGLPLTSGFPAELLIIVSVLQTHTGAGLAALFGMVLGAAYFLSLYRKAFFGPVTSPVVAQAMDLRPREMGVMLLFAALIIAVGIYPVPVLEIIEKSGALWVSRVVG
jgi:NADH-quinone oxidoreductase subunit M